MLFWSAHDMLIWTTFASLMPFHSVINLVLSLSPKQDKKFTVLPLRSSMPSEIHCPFSGLDGSPNFSKNSSNSSLATHPLVSSAFSFPWYRRLTAKTTSVSSSLPLFLDLTVGCVFYLGYNWPQYISWSVKTCQTTS